MDEEIKKSIELGFNGKTPIEFYEKWKYTNKKRKIHLFELIGFICLFFLFLMVYKSTYLLFEIEPTLFNTILVIITLIFIIAILIAIIKNIMTWIDMFKIIKERKDEYELHKKRHRKH